MGMVADRVFKVLDTTSNIDDAGTQVADTLKVILSLKKSLLFYEDEEVLKEFRFNVKSEILLPLLVQSGAGKSTIINLLNRIYAIKSGEILIDNVNIKDVTLNSIKTTAVVFQDVFLFVDTILNNITL
jgi:subfamily B ATP-binding cassette protein MsbA